MGLLNDEEFVLFYSNFNLVQALPPFTKTIPKPGCAEDAVPLLHTHRLKPLLSMCVSFLISFYPNRMILGKSAAWQTSFAL